MAGVNETECATGEGTRAGKRQIIERCTNFKINDPYLLYMLHPKSCILVFSGVGVLAKGIHCVRHKLLDGRLQ